VQRFELGTKFFEINVEGASLTQRWGRTDGDAQVKTQTFANEAAASSARDKLVAEKLKKGFKAIGGKPKVKKAPKQTAERVVVPPSVQRTRATGTIDHDELVVKELRQGGGRTGRIVIDGKRVMAAGEQCLASSDGKTFHRRRSPGECYCLFTHDGAVYSLGSEYSVSRDFGQSWKSIEIEGDENYPYYKFTVFRDSTNTWWMGCDDGVILTSDHPETNWKKARFEGTGKVLDIQEIDGRLFFMGYGSHVADGKALKKLKGIDKEHIICRMTEAPSGVLIAVGDGGVTYRSTDRGASWTFVKSGVRDDLEDLDWVAGTLFVVGGDGTILKTTDDGESWTKIDTGTDMHLWGITSWGDGAIIGGYYGMLLSLSSPDDPYWVGTTDTMAPPPPTIDPSFEPQRAAAEAEREKIFTELYAAAVAQHDQISVKAGISRPRDANPRLAKLVEEAADDDHTPAQVYADWLQGEGDPRGELAAIQIRRATDRKNKELKKAEKELLAQHSDRLLGKLASVKELMKLKWQAGFIHKATIANTHDNDDDDNKKKIEVPDVLSWLLDEPSARFLRELTVGIVTFYENNYEDIAARIGQRYLPSLRTLYLGEFDMEETELSWSELGNLEPLYPALPNLKKLKLRSGSMELGTIIMPRLEVFLVETGGLDHDAARAIANAKWPSLRTLSIEIGSDDYGGDATLEDLQPILDGVGLPHLTHLGIRNCELTDDLIEPLAASKILPQLKTLDLSKGVMSDDGAATLFRLQRAFAHLEEIDVEDNFITREGERLLEQTKLRMEIGEQRDDEGDPSNRYVSVAE
jgi:uncharacterized protein (TIGR02996 family)